MLLHLQATPTWSFGGALFVKPPASSVSASPTSDAAATATVTPLSLSRTGAREGHARPSPSLLNVAETPGWSSFGSVHRSGWTLAAKYDTLEEAIAFARAQGGGDPDPQGDDGEQEAGDSKGGGGSESKETQKEEVGVDFIVDICWQYVTIVVLSRVAILSVASARSSIVYTWYRRTIMACSHVLNAIQYYTVQHV